MFLHWEIFLMEEVIKGKLTDFLLMQLIKFLRSRIRQVNLLLNIFAIKLRKKILIVSISNKIFKISIRLEDTDGRIYSLDLKATK